MRRGAMRLTVIVGVLMGQLLSGAPPIAARVIINDKFPVMGFVRDECSGEDVEFTGVMHIKLREHIDADGVVRSVSTTKLQGKGVGMVSGRNYQVKEKEESEIINHPIICLSLSVLERTTKLISKGGGENMVLRTTVIIGFDENCQPFFLPTLDLECR